MALLDNLYIFVEDEQLKHDIESTSHSVEAGIEITDHIRRKPYELSLSGRIVDYDIKSVLGSTVNAGSEVMKASRVLELLKEYQKKGMIFTYRGRNTVGNMQIQSFSTSHPNTIWGGCEFSMTLKEIRIAKSAYKPTEKKNTGTQQVVKKTSTTDNKTTKTSQTEVYHKVKKGDTVWKLVTKTYKSLEPKYSKTMDKCNWVMKQNPTAFSRKNDFGTLQIGKKILIGYRK